jgi:hypothetical protein
MASDIVFLTLMQIGFVYDLTWKKLQLRWQNRLNYLSRIYVFYLKRVHRALAYHLFRMNEGIIIL